jgi:CBS domain-containing protein
MSSPVTVSVGDTSVGEIRSLMSQKKIHAIPIVEYDKKFPKIETKILGIITVSDLSQKISNKTAIKEVMTSSLVHIVHKNSSAKAAANMMLKHKVHHIVVMDDGEIIGIISSLDFVKLVADHSLE